MKHVFILGLFLLSLGAAASATAASFPIKELGNCRDQQECWLYCEVPAHAAACWSYQTYSAGSVLAETDSASPSPTPLPTPASIFPIAELGNCADVQACKAYCDIPANFAACTAVAQKHGLTRAAAAGQQTALLAHAKEELGCTSLTQCRAFCAEPANAQQCQDLAFKYGSVKSRMAQEKLLREARSALGCQTLNDCRTFCANPLNQEQCRTFTQTKAPMHLLRKLQNKSEVTSNDSSLPCTTLEECRTYCSDPANATACKTSGDSNRVKFEIKPEKNFTCQTKAECERYCQANPDQCPNYAQSRDYKKTLEQRQQRLKESKDQSTKPIELERFRRSLLEKESPTPASDPAPVN